MNKHLKEKILQLREEGYSYSEIKKKLNCSTATISYHCKRYNLTQIGLHDTRKISNEKVLDFLDFYKKNTYKETSIKFNISISSVKKYAKIFGKKRIILTPIERKKRAYIRIKTRRQEAKRKAVEYKGGKCEKCGYNKCIWAFDFHHIDPKKKDFNFSRYSFFSWERLKKELDKCLMFCSNCHRELHYELNELKELELNQ